MKIKIDTTLNCIEAKDTVVGKVYAVSSGSLMLRINVCSLHALELGNRITFLSLDEKDICTVLYPPNQKMVCVGEPTLTIE